MEPKNPAGFASETFSIVEPIAVVAASNDWPFIAWVKWGSKFEHADNDKNNVNDNKDFFIPNSQS
jgi:hypothetical protein